MYRAVEDQLRLQGAADAAAEGYVELRQRAVEHMRENEADFLPFFAQVRCTGLNREWKLQPSLRWTQGRMAL